jgi:metallo-beta-lactamase family protein
MIMYVTFYGAVREVTGSMHLVTTENDRILLDCGLFQGHRKQSAEKNANLPFDPQIITNVILSHAHIDHSGRIPMLTKGNFNGRIICTRATAAACGYLLPDSAHIQESDSDYLNYKTLRTILSQIKPSKRQKMGIDINTREIKKLFKKNRHNLDTETIDNLIDTLRLEKVQPLYTRVEAGEALDSFDGYPYRHPVSIGKTATCTMYDAGHILGSAITMLRLQENGKAHTVCYSGDIGRFGKPIIRDPTLVFSEQDQTVDLMIIESTYGNRNHDPVRDLKPQLKKVLIDTYNRGGSILIPSFAFGRTQELLYVLHELYNEGDVPRPAVYVDSPLATNLTRVFGEHPELYDQDTHATFLEKHENPFSSDQIRFVESVEESMSLNREEKPHIVIAASGMCESGRILHHLRYKMHNQKNTILIVGFMAQNTLGRRILEEGQRYEKAGRKGPPPILRLLNKEYPLKARVINLGGFSAHGDRNEMLRFLKESNLQIKKIAVVHGEEDQALSFAKGLENAGFQAKVPKLGESISIKN